MRIYLLAIAFLICTAAHAQVIRAEPFYTAPEAGVTNLLLDDYPGAAVAYSLRKLDKDYTGSAIRVRRSNDNAEQDIGFVNNYLDTAAMKTFVGNNNGFVVTWYNQADSSGVFGVRNVTQSTAAAQPRIINSGTIDLQNTKPTVRFDGSDDFLNGGNILSVGSNSLMSYTVARFAATSGQSLYAKAVAADEAGRFALISETNLLLGIADGTSGAPVTTFNISSAFTSTSQNLFNQEFIANSSHKTYVNNSQAASLTTGITTIGAGNRRFLIGAYGNFNDTAIVLPHNGNIQEIIIYLSNESSNRSNVNTSINSFYSIY